MGYVAIPHNLLGTTLNEFQIQSALRRLNPDMNFDWSSRLNLVQIKKHRLQGIWWKNKHICSMDRGQIPQAPIWSTKREFMRVKYEDATTSERIDPMYSEEVEYLVDGTQKPTGYVYVNREVKDDLLFIGWQATLRKVLNHNIPGVTRAALERELGVTIDPLKEVEAQEVAATRTHLYDGSGREITL